jgi:type I restriction enzyme R subunit
LKREKNRDGVSEDLKNLEFEFVLFSSAVIDYDYILKLIAQYSQAKPNKQKMSKEQLIRLLSSNSSFMNEREDMIAYINTLKVNEGLTEEQVRNGFKVFKAQKAKKDISDIASKHGLDSDVLYGFIESIMDRMIFDGDKLSELMAPFDLGWKERTKKEEVLMEDLIPFFKKLADGREISGLTAYE